MSGARPMGGFQSGGEIVCHAHNGKFNSVDGRATCLPATKGLNKIDIVVIDGIIYTK